jgi:cytochrome P450
MQNRELKHQHQSPYKNMTSYNLIFHTFKEKFSFSWTWAKQFFWGRLSAHIPHVPGWPLIGHTSFTQATSKKLTQKAFPHVTGVTSYCPGPAFSAVFVATNEARQRIIRESQIGILDDEAADFDYALFEKNNTRKSFFRPLNSTQYQQLRSFLLRRFFHGADERLPSMVKNTSAFLKTFHTTQKNPLQLREFITLLVLHTSSHLLGLSDTTLDTLVLEQEKFLEAINKVAKYGIVEKGNPEFEKILYQFFLRVFESNFKAIASETEENNFIRAIFYALDVPFPKSFDSFLKLAPEIQHEIAMTFSSIGLGAMVHSTVNSFDWALATLLKDNKKLNELIALMAKHPEVDLCDESVYHKEGVLFPIAEWVMHNVFLRPTFSHELFPVLKPHDVTLPDKSKLSLPKKSLIVVNYEQCNRSTPEMISASTFAEHLSESKTIDRFIQDKRVASFGGSKRLCPGAKTSLLEQMIMLAIMLRDFSLQLIDANKTSLDKDPKQFPLCTRQNTGKIALGTKTEELKQEKADEPRCHFRFFNRVRAALPTCDSQTARKLLKAGATIATGVILSRLV